jgi:hypothetical protein
MEIELDFFNYTDDILIDKEIRVLLESANILASSKKTDNLRKALDIATTLPIINRTKSVTMSSLLILKKLGNFPGVKLLEDKTNTKNYKGQLNGMALLKLIFQSAKILGI